MNTHYDIAKLICQYLPLPVLNSLRSTCKSFNRAADDLLTEIKKNLSVAPNIEDRFKSLKFKKIKSPPILSMNHYIYENQVFYINDVQKTHKNTLAKFHSDQSDFIAIYDANQKCTGEITCKRFESFVRFFLDDQYLVIAQNYSFAVYDFNNGRFLWDYSITNDCITAITVVSEAMYFGTRYDHLHRIEMKTGKVTSSIRCGIHGFTNLKIFPDQFFTFKKDYPKKLIALKTCHEALICDPYNLNDKISIPVNDYDFITEINFLHPYLNILSHNKLLIHIKIDEFN